MVVAVDNVLNAEITPKTPDKKLSELRQTLNKNYDNFVKNHGYINAPKNLTILGSDPNYGRVAAIERYNEDKKSKTVSAEKADIFFKRVNGEINYSRSLGTFSVEGKSYSAKNTSTWGVPGTHWSFLDLLEAAMNRKNPRVTYKDEKGNILTDEVKTAAVRQKIEEIRQEFAKWIWTDEERKKDLLKTYNTKFNSEVLRKYNGSYLQLNQVALDIREKL